MTPDEGGTLVVTVGLLGRSAEALAPSLAPTDLESAFLAAVVELHGKL